jgi:hypothetical protein
MLLAATGPRETARAAPYLAHAHALFGLRASRALDKNPGSLQLTTLRQRHPASTDEARMALKAHKQWDNRCGSHDLLRL